MAPIRHGWLLALAVVCCSLLPTGCRCDSAGPEDSLDLEEGDSPLDGRRLDALGATSVQPTRFHRGVLSAAVENATMLVAASQGCLACCGSQSCGTAYMDVKPGKCCAKEPMTCCPWDATCAPDGCRRQAGYRNRRTHSGAPFGVGGLLSLLCCMGCFFAVCSSMMNSASPDHVVQGTVVGGYPPPGGAVPMGGPAYGGGGGYGGGGYGTGALLGAGGGGFLGGLGLGMMMDNMMQPNYNQFDDGGGMYGGGDSWMPADGGGGGDMMAADGGGDGGF